MVMIFIIKLIRQIFAVKLRPTVPQLCIRTTDCIRNPSITVSKLRVRSRLVVIKANFRERKINVFFKKVIRKLFNNQMI